MGAMIVHLTRTIDLLKRNAGHYAAYVAVLYYVDIIAVMFSLLFIYGKPFAVITGVILSLALTAHIIGLAFRAKASRVAQLVITDIHAAYSVMVLAVLVSAGPASALAAASLAYRLLVLVAEVPLVFVLTDGDVASTFGPSASRP